MGKGVDSKRRQNTRQPTPRFFCMVGEARRDIFKGFKVSGTCVDRKLGGWSRVPTVVRIRLCMAPKDTNHNSKNAFMACLPDLDIYSLLTVDLLHKFELGVWKALLTHILQILTAHSANAINEFDRR